MCEQCPAVLVDHVADDGGTVGVADVVDLGSLHPPLDRPTCIKVHDL